MQRPFCALRLLSAPVRLLIFCKSDDFSILAEQAKEEECSRIYEEWKGAADITFHQDVLDQVEVKTVMKDLL